MRIGRRVFICTLLGGVALGAQGERPSSAAAMTHIGKGYELVQNDRLAEAAQEFRADKSEVINNLILSAIIILGLQSAAGSRPRSSLRGVSARSRVARAGRIASNALSPWTTSTRSPTPSRNMVIGPARTFVRVRR
jgi:hypothetical protein